MSTQISLSIKKELRKSEKIILMLVDVSNKNEINLLTDRVEIIFAKRNSLIKNICKERNYPCIKDDSTKLYILIPNDTILASELANDIYVKSQNTCIDSESIYLEYKIASLVIMRDDIQIAKVMSTLSHMISNLTEYYSHYTNLSIVNEIRNNNYLLSKIRNSLIRKELYFAYQPIIDRNSRRVKYYECLLRISSSMMLESISHVIKNAENNGLISIVDSLVIEMAVKQLVSDTNIRLSINISNSTINSPVLLNQIKYLLEKYNVGNRLIIEITETTLSNNLEITRNFILTLRKYGCKFALDDFGSGFTSLKQLLELPIDIVKIDGSYIRDILNKNNHSKIFVKTVIKLARDLNVETVAEFVENAQIAYFLDEIKVDSMQGNFFLPAL